MTKTCPCGGCLPYKAGLCPQWSVVNPPQGLQPDDEMLTTDEFMDRWYTPELIGPGDLP